MGRKRKDTEKTKALHLKTWKVGKYIRLSRDDGNCESESIVNQRKILEEQIPSFFEQDYEIIDEYIDDGRTGTSDDTRPDFLRLIEDVKRGRINCIITKNLSRAFRNSANQGKFLEEFIPLYHTRFISLYEPRIDTFLNPEIVHSLEVGITGFINEQYAYKTSMDIRRTLDMKRKKGEFIGAFAPYGYRKNPENRNTLILDEEAAEVVRDIFHWFVYEGMSKSGIARRLNETGVPNPAMYKQRKGLKYTNPQKLINDGLWSDKTIAAILANEVYIGTMVQGRQRVISYKVHQKIRTDEKDWYVVPNMHEAVIDAEIFRQAQSLHQRDTRTAPGKKTLYLFSGFLKCADCNRHMTRKSSKGYTYYSCSTYKKKSKTHCTKHSIREDVLEKAVLLAIRKQIALAEDLNHLSEEMDNRLLTDIVGKRIKRGLEAKKAELRKLESIADTLYMDWRTGEITREAYCRIKEKYKMRMTQIETAIAKLTEEKVELEKARNVQEAGVEVLIKQKTIPYLERRLLVELVDTIYVHENGALTILFRFADPYKKIMEYIERNEKDQVLLQG